MAQHRNRPLLGIPSDRSEVVRRVTISLTARDNVNLLEVACSANLSENDAIRQALMSQVFISRVLRDGGRLLVRDRWGVEHEVVME